MSEIEISQPTDLERGEVNETTLALDLDTLLPDQIKSHALALRLEVGRVRKTLGETQSTVEFLSKTVKEQSDTLNNREELLKEAEHARDELTQQMDGLLDTHERMKAETLAKLQEGTIANAAALSDALETYGIAIARVSDTSYAPHVAITLIQMAMHIKGMDWPTAMAWLRGEPLKTTS